MNHSMRLREKPFKQIKNGVKTIELRLYDEKRQGVSVGDTILFECVELPSERVMTKVVAIHRFDSFQILFESLDTKKCGFLDKTDYKEMELYYTKEQQSLYGVVGIEVQVVRVLQCVFKKGVFSNDD